MSSRRPTRPPPGRLVRLGVVLPGELDPARRRFLAALAERAGHEAVWTDTVDALADLAAVTTRCAVGLDLAVADARTARAAACAVAAAAPGRGELTLTAPAAALIAAAEVAGPNGDRPQLAAVASRGPGHRPGSCVPAVVDDVVFDAAAVPDLRPGPGEPGRAARLAIALGRTDAEAQARAARDPAFPAAFALVGTLEAVQDRLADFAAGGVTDVRVRIPDGVDVLDVLAQLRAAAVGDPARADPNRGRSPTPPPPAGWGAPRPVA